MSKDKQLLDKAYDRKNMDEVAALYREWATTYDDDVIDVTNASYDAAISVGTFTHNHVGPNGIDEVLRIVKPGGIASITVNADAYIEDGYRAKFDSLVADGTCSLIEERDEAYIIARGVRSRIVVLRKNSGADR